MVSDHQAAANQPTVDDEQSHLLKLPPEIRIRIYELVLTVDYSFMITEIYKPLRPGLLQDSRQLRAETRLMYHELMEHDIVVTINNTAEIRRRAETLADDELRSIQSLNFHFVKKYGRLTYAKRTRRFKALGEFREMIRSLEQRSGAGNIKVKFARLRE